MMEEKEDQPIEELYEHHRFEADKGQNPLRVDKFLGNYLENTSRNRIQTAAKAQCIRVNNKPVKANYKVKPGDVVQVVFPHPPREIELIPKPWRQVKKTRKASIINRANLAPGSPKTYKRLSSNKDSVDEKSTAASKH